MATNLSSRLEKLEAEARIKDKPYPKVARLIAKEGEEAEAFRQAEEIGLDLSPEGNDLLILRLITQAPKRRAH